MSRLLFATGSRGQAIEDIQASLHFVGHDLDGRFGNQTRTAVAAFQRDRGLPETGQVDDVSWNRLVQKPIPPVFERCLAVTAAFEGHGFSLAQGNFDGAGITWGIIGFTLKHGEIAKIVLGMERSHPDLVRLAFEENTPRLLELLQAPLADQLEFANSVSIGTKKVLLAEPWRSSFDLFGKLPAVRAEQLRLAREDYFDPAVETAAKFDLASELGLALAFDIHVQNGGIKRAAADAIRAATPPADEAGLRAVVADAVADASSAAFREDVRARKRTIAAGQGTVHGEFFTLSNWGVGDFPARET